MQSQNNLDTPQLLMCVSKHFDVQYVINPWMQHNVNSLNKIKAEAQWHSLQQIICRYTDVEIVDSVEEFLDMVFIANAGLVIDNKCVVSNFRYPERRGETPVWKEFFISRGYEVLCLPPHLYFEGEGDALYDNVRKCLWSGYNKRSSLDSYKYIGDFFHTEIVPLELVDNYYYHLDTCFSILPKNFIMYVPDAFSQQTLSDIYSRVPSEKRIEVTKLEAAQFTCNAITLGEVIVCNSASERIKKELARIGFTIIETPLSEFIKSGGASKCMVLTLYES